jgi:hypothetical protein
VVVARRDLRAHRALRLRSRLKRKTPVEINIVPIDKQNFYRMEIFGDERSGAIHRLSPVLPDGSPDPIRTPLFKAVTTLQFPDGAILNVNTLIPARTLEEAMDAFVATVTNEVQKAIENARAQHMAPKIITGVPAANGRLPRR